MLQDKLRGMTSAIFTVTKCWHNVPLCAEQFVRVSLKCTFCFFPLHLKLVHLLGFHHFLGGNVKLHNIKTVPLVCFFHSLKISLAALF